MKDQIIYSHPMGRFAPYKGHTLEWWRKRYNNELKKSLKERQVAITHK